MAEDSKQSQFIAPPPKWGEDELSRFQEFAYQNEWATFARLPKMWEILDSIDKAFFDCANQSMQRIGKVQDPSGLLLIGYAHNHYRAALRLCTSGHSLAVFPAGRAALEAALYGWYLIKHTGAAERWNNKPSSGDKRRKWGGEFAFGSINQKLADVNKETASRAKHLHETAINFGSHPNSIALHSNIVMQEAEDGLHIELHYLHTWDRPFANSVKFVCEIGLVATDIIGIASPEVANACNLDRRHLELVSQYVELQRKINAEFGRKVKESN
jgi:hypothetical protein